MPCIFGRYYYAFSLYYRKFCLKATQSFSSKTDVYSNCDAVIYNGFALANWFVIAMNKATSHGLYYRKLSRRVYSPARLMVIQIGSTKHCFASALAQILNLFQNLLPIVYIMCSCESDKKFTFWHLSNKHNIYRLYYSILLNIF